MQRLSLHKRLNNCIEKQKKNDWHAETEFTKVIQIEKRGIGLSFRAGQIVKSRAGRDCGRYFAIVGIINEDYVLLCDGILRKIEKPKKKKVRHIDAVGYLPQETTGKILKGERLTNFDIKTAIQNIMDKPV